MKKVKNQKFYLILSVIISLVLSIACLTLSVGIVAIPVYANPDGYTPDDPAPPTPPEAAAPVIGGAIGGMAAGIQGVADTGAAVVTTEPYNTGVGAAIPVLPTVPVCYKGPPIEPYGPGGDTPLIPPLTPGVPLGGFPSAGKPRVPNEPEPGQSGLPGTGQPIAPFILPLNQDGALSNNSAPAVPIVQVPDPPIATPPTALLANEQPVPPVLPSGPLPTAPVNIPGTAPGLITLESITEGTHTRADTNRTVPIASSPEIDSNPVNRPDVRIVPGVSPGELSASILATSTREIPRDLVELLTGGTIDPVARNMPGTISIISGVSRANLENALASGYLPSDIFEYHPPELGMGSLDLEVLRSANSDPRNPNFYRTQDFSAATILGDRPVPVLLIGQSHNNISSTIITGDILSELRDHDVTTFAMEMVPTNLQGALDRFNASDRAEIRETMQLLWGELADSYYTLIERTIDELGIRVVGLELPHNMNKGSAEARLMYDSYWADTIRENLGEGRMAVLVGSAHVNGLSNILANRGIETSRVFFSGLSDGNTISQSIFNNPADTLISLARDRGIQDQLFMVPTVAQSSRSENRLDWLVHLPQDHPGVGGFGYGRSITGAIGSSLPTSQEETQALEGIQSYRLDASSQASQPGSIPDGSSTNPPAPADRPRQP